MLPGRLQQRLCRLRAPLPAGAGVARGGALQLRRLHHRTQSRGEGSRRVMQVLAELAPRLEVDSIDE